MQNVFKQANFDIFEIEGLENRMAYIRKDIQPIFQALGDTFTPIVAEKTGYPMFFHIAQHRRRTSNPPESTWCAIGGDKRGYKKYPHLQIGINDDHIFIFLSIIDNPIYETEMGKALLLHPDHWKALDDSYVLSGDHTKPTIEPLTEKAGVQILERLLKVKKGEFLIERVIENGSSLLENPEAQSKFIKKTISQLIPLYRQLLDIHFEQSGPAL
ncbi:DUF1054 domain-containing protein [Marinilactibacillus kalidii]|uniref:DUF1054 domain-containing protein n=1 Tax=Marinilactibacillus kalidii TaxID=2820274 RepID=UPI001ABDC58C|nr:DUF1054 domain-containing protein [Marinilactibacillus kalidii]